MKNKKLTIYKNKLVLRAQEAAYEIQSHNYISFVEGAFLAATYAQHAAMFKAAASQLRDTANH